MPIATGTAPVVTHKMVGRAALVQALLFIFVPINLTLIQGARFPPADFANPDVLMNAANWPVLLIAPLVQFTISITLLVTALGLSDLFKQCGSDSDAPMHGHGSQREHVAAGQWHE